MIEMRPENLEAIGRAYMAVREHDRRMAGAHNYGVGGCTTCREHAAAQQELEDEYQTAMHAGTEGGPFRCDQCPRTAECSYPACSYHDDAGAPPSSTEK
jgi:hypothetical protein